jgi:hypothetical protein
MKHQRHLDRVRGLVSGQSGAPPSEITPETRLLEDLGMTCRGGTLLLAVFASEFGIDMRGVAPANYFRDATAIPGNSAIIAIAAALVPGFRARAQRAARGLRTLRVRDLVVSAQKRRWVRHPLARKDAVPDRMTAGAWAVLAVGALVPVAAGMREWLLRGTGPGKTALAALIGLGAVAALLGLRFLLALAWLRRIDAAAAHEERHLTSAD